MDHVTGRGQSLGSDSELNVGDAPDDLRRLQLTQLRITKDIARVCDKHGIAYFLLGGSALGARRHEGFIPWDDDMDLAMLRPEYERFLAVADAELPPDLYVQNWRRDPNMGVPFTKIRLNNSRLIERSSQHTGGHKGIAVDVFPLDNAPDGALRFQRHRFEVMFWRRLLRHQLRYTNKPLSGVLAIADIMVRGIARLLPVATAKRCLHATLTRYASIPTRRVTVMGSSYSYPKHTLQRDWATRLELRTFEGEQFLCSAAIDDYLRQLYGDFMTLPPLEQRGVKHTILELDFAKS